MALETYFLLQDVRFNENLTYLKGPTVIAFSGQDSKTLHAVAIQLAGPNCRSDCYCYLNHRIGLEQIDVERIG